MWFLATLLLGLYEIARWVFYGTAEAVGTLLGKWDVERAKQREREREERRR